MVESALHSRVLLWRLLAKRRDIDLLTLELIGKYQIDRETCDGSGTRKGLAFDLVCHLEMIFDLQRIHLQARTPYSDAQDGIADRLPYLLSLSTAKGAFMCLAKLAEDCPEWAQQGNKRRIYIRALLSGVRMLCLHPNVRPEEILANSVQYNQNFNLQSLDTEEKLLTHLCHETLRQTPDIDQDLVLTTSAMNMYPIIDLQLKSVTKDYIENFADDPLKKYWTLYDISWRIVAAFVQFLANNPDETGDDIAILASWMANYTIEAINRTFDRSEMKKDGNERTLLLADVVGILYPILAFRRKVVDEGWRDVYKYILNTHTNRDSVYQEPTYISALAKFQQTLTQRQKVLRDSDDDISALCLSIPQICLAAVHDYNSQNNNSSRDPTNPMRFYVTNCGNSHIITHNNHLSRLIRENANLTENPHADLILFPQEEVCPICRDLSQEKTYTRLKKISPLNRILHIIDQKKQELQKLRLERQSDFRAEARTTATIAEHRPPSQQPEPGHSQQPKCNALNQPKQLQLKPVSSMSGLTAKFFGTKKNRLSRESSTLGSIPSSAKSEAFIQDIKFNRLDDTAKNTTLSADGSLFIFWNKEHLEVHDDRGYRVAVTNFVSNPMLVTAATNCCAVVGGKKDHDKVECYNLTTGLLCYQRDFVARVRCLAISANDVYLAVWLDTGILYLIKLLTRTIFREQEIKPRPPESAVHCLSFSSNDEELIITKRVDEKVHIYHYLVLEGSRSGRLTCGLSKYETDDQGISSSLHSPSKKLSCITSWTNSGVPLLYDWGNRVLVPWNKTLDDLNIGNRIYLAVWSKSGKILVLVNSLGTVYKITINDTNSIEAREIAITERMYRKSFDVGQPQLLDVKISQDETQIVIAWINSKHQAFVQPIPVD